MHNLKLALVMTFLAGITACSQPNPAYVNARYTPPDMAEIQARAASMKAGMAKTAADCPWPATGTYGHTSQVFDNTHRPAPMPAEITHAFTTGCAIITFTVDDDGTPTNAHIVSANPAGSGLTALQIVQRNTYVRGDTPGTAFLLRIGLEKHPDGTSSVSEMSR